jgi:hypothetical protein
MTEQECFDEYMMFCDLQTKDNRFGSKGFGIGDSAYNDVLLFIDKMNAMGLPKNVTSTDKFRNYFFKCSGRTFSICIYANGFMELRWG